MKQRKRRDFIFTIFLHSLLLIAAYIFQGAVFPYIRLGGYVPLLLPVVVTGVALYEGRDTGGICGLFAGILCDISFNQPVGTFTVTLTIIGLGVGILSDTVLLSGLINYFISNTVVLILCAFVQMTPIVATPNNIPPLVIVETITMQTLYTLVIAFFIWPLIRGLGRRKDKFRI